MVRAATSAEASALAEVLARAFRDDPLHRWLLPTDSDWERKSHRLWAPVLRPRIVDGTVFTTPHLEGAAIWLAPERVEPSLLESSRMALETLPLIWRRAVLVSRGMRRMRAAHPPEPHWYLLGLGTDPVSQNQGVASALLRPVLQRCDTEGLSAYLESSNRKHTPLYERHGFEVCGEIELPRGPTIWSMLRKPREPNGGVHSRQRGADSDQTETVRDVGRARDGAATRITYTGIRRGRWSSTRMTCVRAARAAMSNVSEPPSHTVPREGPAP